MHEQPATEVRRGLLVHRLPRAALVATQLFRVILRRGVLPRGDEPRGRLLGEALGRRWPEECDRSRGISGEVPAQKWMNFYTKVLTRFVRGAGVKLTVTVEATPEGGVSEQATEETKLALRELGLKDDVKAD